MAFSLGLVANGLSLLLTRAFFSLQRPDVPTRVAAVNLVLNAVLDIALLRYGAAGIALSTSIVTAFNATVLAIALRSRVGSLHGREVRRHTGPDRRGHGLLRRGGVRRVVAARPAAGPLVPRPGGLAGAGLACGGVAYLAAAQLLAIPEWRSVAWPAGSPSPGVSAGGRLGRTSHEDGIPLLGAAGHAPSDRERGFGEGIGGVAVVAASSAAPVRSWSALWGAALPHPQLLDHRPHRPRQVDAGRPHPADHRRRCPNGRCATRCSTRWSSSASGGSPSRRRRCACCSARRTTGSTSST